MAITADPAAIGVAMFLRDRARADDEERATSELDSHRYRQTRSERPGLPSTVEAREIEGSGPLRRRRR